MCTSNGLKLTVLLQLLCFVCNPSKTSVVHRDPIQVRHLYASLCIQMLAYMCLWYVISTVNGMEFRLKHISVHVTVLRGIGRTQKGKILKAFWQLWPILVNDNILLKATDFFSSLMQFYIVMKAIIQFISGRLLKMRHCFDVRFIHYNLGIFLWSLFSFKH